MGSTLGNVKLTFNLDLGNDDCLWVSKRINIAGTIIQEQYIENWPNMNSRICAIVVNQIAWYGIHLILYDQRSNQCVKAKIVEVHKKEDITGNIDKIIECLLLSRDEPWKALYAEYNINRQPPFIKQRLYDIMRPIPGDMIRVYRGSGIGFYHYGIYVSDDRIVHVTSPQVGNAMEFTRLSANGSITSGTVENAFVQITDWKTFVLNSRYIETIYTPLNYYNIDRRIKNALNSADNEALKGGYNVLDNNCEHFARYILYGYRHSVQSDKFNVVIGKKSAHIMDRSRSKSDNSLNEEEISNSYNEPTILVPPSSDQTDDDDEKSLNENKKKRKKRKKRRKVSKSNRI